MAQFIGYILLVIGIIFLIPITILAIKKVLQHKKADAFLYTCAACVVSFVDGFLFNLYLG